MAIDEIFQQAQILWDYMRLDQPLQRSGCLLVMGSHDIRVAEYGAKLILDGWAPLMVCSGGLGNYTSGIWDEAEAVKYARVAEEMGVPPEKILVEDKSTNTGENVLFSRELLHTKRIHPNSMLLVHKPYMERRALATFQKLWPEMPARVSSPPIPMKDYPNHDISMDEMLQIMVGDFQRILVYPKKGFQVEQKVPARVIKAFQYLANRGYKKHLLDEN
jgi:uncharacterized SAM-binding protein YcdF (DUF218 family)